MTSNPDYVSTDPALQVRYCVGYTSHQHRHHKLAYPAFPQAATRAEDLLSMRVLA